MSEQAVTPALTAQPDPALPLKREDKSSGRRGPEPVGKVMAQLLDSALASKAPGNARASVRVSKPAGGTLLRSGLRAGLR